MGCIQGFIVGEYEAAAVCAGCSAEQSGWSKISHEAVGTVQSIARARIASQIRESAVGHADARCIGTGLGEGGGPGIVIYLGEGAETAAGHDHICFYKVDHGFAELEGHGDGFTGCQNQIGGGDV